MKKNHLIFLLILPIFYLLLEGCVETITDPPDKLAPRVELWSPVSEDTVKNGRNYLSFYAEDDIGLYYCEVYVNGMLNIKFDADSTHALPDKIYFWIDESMINSRINYFIKVYDLWGNVTTSAEMSNLLVTENTSPPDAPEKFSIELISESVLKMNWEDVSDNEQGFETWRKEENHSYELLKTLPKNSITAFDSSISATKIYYYKIRAYNKFGKSAFTTEINSAGIGALSAPANLTGTALGMNQIKLTWQDRSTRETRFKIERKNTGDQYFAHLVYIDSNKTEYTDRYNMYSGGSYTYRVAATNKTNISEWSNEVDVITLSENISTPANLTAKLNSLKKSVKLTWSDYNNSSVEAKIERKSLGGTYTQVASIPAELKLFEDSLITMGNYYTYRVRILTGQGNYSLYSNEASIAVPVIAPNAPGELELYKFSEYLFNLRWKDNSNDEDGFQLWRSDGSITNFRIVKQLAPNATSINEEITNSSIIYYYKIRAYRDTLFSEFSNLINSTGGSGLYPRPGDFSVKALCPSKVQITWKDNTADELGFRIERRTSWTTFNQIALLPPNSQSFIDESGLSAGIEFIYRIQVFSSTQESDWSEEIHIMMPSTGDCGG